MSLVLASIVALAVAPPSASSVDAGPADEAAVAVAIDLGPPLVRHMGAQITVRRAGDDPVTYRPVAVLEVAPPATRDDVPPPLGLELPPGAYVLEAEASGFLPSTRALTVGDGAAATLRWELVLDSSHRTVRFPVVGATGEPTLRLSARHLRDEQAPVTCVSKREVCELRLRRGAWELEATAAGYHPLLHKFDVGEAERQSVDLAFAPVVVEAKAPEVVAPPAPPAPPDNGRRLVLGLSLTAVPLLAAGLPLTIFGPLRYGQWRRHPVCDRYEAECGAAIIPPIHYGAAGAGMLGAAVGLGVSAITASRVQSAQGWWATLGIGSALTLAGGSWLVANSILLDRGLKYGPLEDVDARTRRRLPSSILAGAGLGLLGGSIAGLVLRQPVPGAARLTPYGGPGQAGALLVGHF